MTTFDRKINQIAARHGWSIEKQPRAAVPCYIIAAPTYEDTGKIVAVLNRCKGLYHETLTPIHYESWAVKVYDAGQIAAYRERERQKAALVDAFYMALKANGGGRVRSSHRRRGRGVIHGKAAHGKRPTENRQQKRGRPGAGRVYLFFRVKFSGGWNHPPPLLLSSGGWNPSRAILSRVAFTIYPATLSPAWAAAVFKSSSISFGILIDFVANFDK